MSSSDTPAGEGRDDRLAQLESKLTFLEHTVDVLSGELEAQQGHTRRLQKTLEGLREQLGSLQRDTGISDQPDEPPPHY
ncbi:SlyX family protein [Wenzhouxiangella sp. XN79A]|uniref:SlyX family protein n=1 Tax=Wenzhouxiangella sp. XN79A TaxID=2724193 RepID=UPI00144A6DA5|nr:SlyX family protein [Wenzhouxiangella sp. XN79A]NKI34008.1 SlyX family protein [Wenzhouxiangella sp. XN79A]